MKKLLIALLPPLLLGLLLSLVFIVPDNPELQDSAVSPDLPLGQDIPGWYGTKMQESEAERIILAPDTRFSKAAYQHINPFTFAREDAVIDVSIVYSGNDMNMSIHRPERCLPAQGHVNIVGSSEEIELCNGRTITFHRLDSHTDKGGQRLNHINYYVFVGHESITSTHLGRTLYDISDRIIKGRAQRWAYFQLGICWGGLTGVTQQQAESYLRSLIRELAARQIDWSIIKN
ncbi:MAG: exosortase-associated EpsI family protein [Akkermansia sp.]|nr:exosortase-associated EpsI family protein [Akkermansia sp.]